MIDVSITLSDGDEIMLIVPEEFLDEMIETLQTFEGEIQLPNYRVRLHDLGHGACVVECKSRHNEDVFHTTYACLRAAAVRERVRQCAKWWRREERVFNNSWRK